MLVLIKKYNINIKALHIIKTKNITYIRIFDLYMILYIKTLLSSEFAENKPTAVWHHKESANTDVINSLQHFPQVTALCMKRLIYA